MLQQPVPVCMLQERLPKSHQTGFISEEVLQSYPVQIHNQIAKRTSFLFRDEGFRESEKEKRNDLLLLGLKGKQPKTSRTTKIETDEKWSRVEPKVLCAEIATRRRTKRSCHALLRCVASFSEPVLLPTQPKTANEKKPKNRCPSLTSAGAHTPRALEDHP